jgi:hypothetical protein
MERFQEFSRVRYIKSTSEGKCRLSNQNLPRILFPSRFQSLTAKENEMEQHPSVQNRENKLFMLHFCFLSRRLFR